MGQVATLDGKRKLFPGAFSVKESSTPLASSDSTGAVGSFTISIATGEDPAQWLMTKGSPISFSDSRRGLISGSVQGIDPDYASGQTAFTCLSRLAELNVYNVRAMPFVGTLGEALRYYFGLADVTERIEIHADIAKIPVVILGWQGELWFKLKQFAAAYSFEIALISDIIVVRPIRTRIAISDRDASRAVSAPGTQLAYSVEVYYYDARPLNRSLVYPQDGWNPEVSIITVTAGETVEHDLSGDFSLLEVEQPVCVYEVTPEYNASSVYTVVGNDGIPVTPSAWTGAGGGVFLQISDDSEKLTAIITAPKGLPDINGKELTSFSLAMSSGPSEGRYSSLRVVGSGIVYRKEKLTFKTGVPRDRAPQEVGITIDNPCITSKQTAFDVGVRTATRYNGLTLSLGGTVTAVNRLGDKGIARRPSYAEVKAQVGTMTFAAARAHPLFAGKTFQQVVDVLAAQSEAEFENQAFGNAAGARVWDPKTRRWFRIREFTHAPGTSTFEAEEDTTFADAKDRYKGMTYAEVKAKFAGLTYREVLMKGLA